MAESRLVMFAMYANFSHCFYVQALKGQRVSYEADLWALGCILYQMLIGKPPFRAGSEYLTFKRIQDHDLTLPQELDEDAKELIQGLLAEDPTLRLGKRAARCAEETYGDLRVLYDHLKAHPAQ